MNEHLMLHVIAQSVFQLWKDVNKTACKQNVIKVSTARYLLEKWSLVKSINSKILDYILIIFYFTC